MSSLLVGSVLKLINDFGQTTTYTHITQGNYQPGNGGTSPATSTDYTIKAYFANYNLMDVSSVVEGKRTVCLPTVDTSGSTLPEPDTGDKFVGVTGDDVVVNEVQKVYSGNLVVCYICVVNE